MLIVTLPSPQDSGAEYDYAVASNTYALTSHGRTALALLPKSDRTMVLVPAAALSWHKVQLPKLSRNASSTKVRAMLAGLLEEQLLDEPERLHLAQWQQKLGNTPQDWITACDKAWLSSSIELLRSAGHYVVALYPQAMPLSDVAGQLGQPPTTVHFSGNAQAAFAAVCAADGVLCLPAQAASALLAPLALAQTVYSVSAEPAVAALAEALCAKLLPDARVQIQPAAQYAVKAAQRAQSCACDLAQFDLGLGSGGRWLQNLQTGLGNLASSAQWRAARLGFIVLALAHIVGLNAWAWHERSAIANKRAHITQLLTTTFPQVKVVVDAPLQMQREVGAIAQASGALTERDFEQLLARFSAVSPINSAQAAIEYVAGELNIKASGIDAAQLEKLASKLQAAGLAASFQADRLVIKPARGGQTGSGGKP